jgi:hypothetical protein
MPQVIVGQEQPPQPVSTLWSQIGPNITVDFRLATESTETVLSVLTETWSTDFSGDFGPDLGGAPFEIGLSAKGAARDNTAPIEILRVARGGAALIENAALFGWDALPPFEALSAIAGGAPAKAGVEVQASARADPPAVTEARATQASDAITAAEAGLVARADPPAAAELGLTMRSATPAQAGVEASAAARADAIAPAEFLGSHQPRTGADTQAPIEVLSTARSPVSGTGQAYAPVEWAVVFRADMLPPGEISVLVRADPPVAAESTAAYRSDLAPVTEALSATARSDATAPLEALLTALRSGALAEFGLALRLDPPLPAEAGETVRTDPNMPAEAGANAARADMMPPFEALLAVRGGNQAPAQAGLEWLTTVRALLIYADSWSPVGTSEVARSDGMPAIELTALSTTDGNAITEWFRSLGIDWRAPKESATMAPAPLFFVTRGRLR